MKYTRLFHLRSYSLNTGITAVMVCFVFWSRFVGIDWGLPYPMHPDERNMVISIQQLSCEDILSKECLHPHFFAYGQLPIYLAAAMTKLVHMLQGDITSPLSYVYATISLRVISALASVGTFVVMIKLLRLFEARPNSVWWFVATGMSAAVPVLIQSAHFGTTESLLMLFYLLLLYEGCLLLKSIRSLHGFVIASGVYLGLSVGLKSSALLFASVPFLAFLLFAYRNGKTTPAEIFFGFVRLTTIALVFFVITSPYNLIDWQAYRGSMAYESSVGTGAYRAFYTRQFENTLPFLFQITRVLPYALGGPVFLLGLIGFICLPLRKDTLFLRFALICFCLPTMALYAKWTRFLAPAYPLMILIAAYFTANLFRYTHAGWNGRIMRGIGVLIAFIAMIPGIAYTSVYTSPDVRFTASEWIVSNISEKEKILSETANVVDIPFPTSLIDRMGKSVLHRPESFRFYDMEEIPDLRYDLSNWRRDAAYIFVPSRRVFYNHTCYRSDGKGGFVLMERVAGHIDDHCARLRALYPQLHEYYAWLFSQSGEFREVARFTSYPHIRMLGETWFEFPDEDAEETWTVFDHPVVRIYRRN